MGQLGSARDQPDADLRNTGAFGTGAKPAQVRAESNFRADSRGKKRDGGLFQERKSGKRMEAQANGSRRIAQTHTR